VTILKLDDTSDSLPAFCSLTLRLEKRADIGQGRFYFRSAY